MNNTQVYNIYTDGSYRDGKGSWAYVVYCNDVQIHEDSGHAPEQYAKQHHNIAGEVYAVYNAIEYAKLCGWKNINIHYDYTGISKWATGEFRATKQMTIAYKKYMKEFMKQMTITFTHVKAHTGNLGNERADTLAKQALE